MNTPSPTSPEHMIACDLGAESGRILLGILKNHHLQLEEIHRFPSPNVFINGSLRWDILAIFSDIITGLKKCTERTTNIRSISVDSWAVDYVWLQGNEPLLSLPYHYRDERTKDCFARVFGNITACDIFAETGIQFMPINTLYQLHDDVLNRPKLLEAADGFLLIADYVHWLLSGKRCIEESLASTTQLYNPQTHQWSERVAQAIHFPMHLFPEVIPSGSIIGPLCEELAESLDLEGTQVIASCSHDTAAAVAAVPAEGDNWAYLSSGTWSLLGVELTSPCINEDVVQYNFTNEIGFGGTIRFLKNVVGLWIVQELRRSWTIKGKEYDYTELTSLAAAAAPHQRWINPSDPRFAKPGSMPRKITQFCEETGQSAPESPGEFIRCVLESLAFAYRQTLGNIEHLTGKSIQQLHIVGGGSNNALLNQMTASATGRTVFAGPSEATAIGNILIQGIANGLIKDLAELRQIVRSSFPIQTFVPKHAEGWTQCYHQFCKKTSTTL